MRHSLRTLFARGHLSGHSHQNHAVTLQLRRPRTINAADISLMQSYQPYRSDEEEQPLHAESDVDSELVSVGEDDSAEPFFRTSPEGEDEEATSEEEQAADQTPTLDPQEGHSNLTKQTRTRSAKQPGLKVARAMSSYDGGNSTLYVTDLIKKHARGRASVEGTSLSGRDNFSCTDVRQNDVITVSVSPERVAILFHRGVEKDETSVRGISKLRTTMRPATKKRSIIIFEPTPEDSQDERVSMVKTKLRSHTLEEIRLGSVEDWKEGRHTVAVEIQREKKRVLIECDESVQTYWWGNAALARLNKVFGAVRAFQEKKQTGP